jgi:tRNA(adenine34) deaminase
VHARPEDVGAVRRALDEAQAALAVGEVPIGAVVLDVTTGAVVGLGRNERERTSDPTAHAEVVALRAAAQALGRWRLDGCVLAVTLEPCPMCAGAAWLARVDRVVFGAWNPEYGAAGSLWDVLRDRRLNHRPEVVGGVLEPECSALLRGFFVERRTSTEGGGEDRSP